MTIDTNELRRLAQEAIHPVTKGRWIRLFGERTVYDRMEDGCRGMPVVSTDKHPPSSFEAACLDFIAAANPAVINSLLERLEAAESDALEQARLNGMGSEREAALMAKLEAAEENRSHFLVKIGKLYAQCDALHAKIEQMEKQAPVAWTTKLALEYGASRLGFQVSGVNMWGEKGVPLYTLPGAHPKPDCGEAGHDEGCCGNRQCLPGAQPAQSVPDGWKLVPIWPTQEMINHVIDERLDALAAGKDHTFIDIYKTMLAAAPEAKP